MTSSNLNVTSGRVGIESSDATAKPFPLPLSPFEHYMLADDRDDYPMVIVLIIELEGKLDRAAFEEAVHQAIVRHPLLACRVQHVPGKGKCWVPATSNTFELDWIDCGESLPDVQQQRMDLTRQTGLRVQVNAKPDRSRVDFHFHHASADGLGGLQFLGDVLACYGRLTASPDAELPELAPVNIDRLSLRTNYCTEETDSEPKSTCCPWRLGKKLLKLLRRGPTPLAVSQAPRLVETESRKGPVMVFRVIERSTVQKLKVVAAQKGVGINDLYLLAMFQVMAEWNRDHKKLNGNHWLRIGMPTSLRTPLHDGMPAANLVSYMFLTRRAGDCLVPEKLLSDIHRQTTAIVNDRQGRYFVNGLRHVLRIPGLLHGLLRLNGCFASAIVSNVGDSRRQFTAQFPLKQGRCVAGNVVLAGLKGTAPVRPNTRISMTTGLYAGSLNINFNCDSKSFTKQQTEDFADRFVKCLREFIPAVAVDVDREAA